MVYSRHAVLDVVGCLFDQSGFKERIAYLPVGDDNVGDVETVLCEFGTGDNETPMTVGGYEHVMVAAL